MSYAQGLESQTAPERVYIMYEDASGAVAFAESLDQLSPAELEKAEFFAVYQGQKRKLSQLGYLDAYNAYHAKRRSQRPSSDAANTNDEDVDSMVDGDASQSSSKKSKGIFQSFVDRMKYAIFGEEAAPVEPETSSDSTPKTRAASSTGPSANGQTQGRDQSAPSTTTTTAGGTTGTTSIPASTTGKPPSALDRAAQALDQHKQSSTSLQPDSQESEQERIERRNQMLDQANALKSQQDQELRAAQEQISKKIGGGSASGEASEQQVNPNQPMGSMVKALSKAMQKGLGNSISGVISCAWDHWLLQRAILSVLLALGLFFWALVGKTQSGWSIRKLLLGIIGVIALQWLLFSWKFEEDVLAFSKDLPKYMAGNEEPSVPDGAPKAQ